MPIAPSGEKIVIIAENRYHFWPKFPTPKTLNSKNFTQEVSPIEVCALRRVLANILVIHLNNFWNMTPYTVFHGVRLLLYVFLLNIIIPESNKIQGTKRGRTDRGCRRCWPECKVAWRLDSWKWQKGSMLSISILFLRHRFKHGEFNVLDQPIWISLFWKFVLKSVIKISGTMMNTYFLASWSMSMKNNLKFLWFIKFSFKSNVKSKLPLSKVLL